MGILIIDNCPKGSGSLHSILYFWTLLFQTEKKTVTCTEHLTNVKSTKFLKKI